MEPLFIDEIDGPTFGTPDDAQEFAERDNEDAPGWSATGGWIA